MNDPKLAERIQEATAIFAMDEGVWDGEVQIWPAPGAPPFTQKGVSTNRRIGGGRWLVVDWKTDGGFEGHGIYGWDATTERYTGCWVDSMQTAISRATGAWDAGRREMSFDVEVTHAGQPVRYREVTEKPEDGRQIYHNYIPLPDGGEHEMIRATYVKRD